MPRASRPPQLAGLTFLEAIGTGGFADVYLYEQALPRRRVAVKVLREPADAAGLALFHAEANVMAQLSGHPAIVPIYQADVSPDGRAYLVMEFCPPPHLAQRFRTERIPVPEVLEIAVKVASAVETAHRAGILHRDIKPHNILTSAYGAPLLTDFGIAATATDPDGAMYGMSVPWSPPESFADPAPLDVRSDVFALGATVYSLLAGRSPFEVPGGANDSATLIHRIEQQSPSRILRADVPDALNDFLLTSLAKSMDARPPSAMAFARGIQEIQIGLQIVPTRLEVMDASPEAAVAAAPVEDPRTQVRPISIIVPDEIVQRGTLLRPRSITQTEDRTAVRAGRPVPDTVGRAPTGPRPGVPSPAPAYDAPGVPDAPLGTAAPAEPRRLLPLLLGLGLVAILGIVTAVSLLAGKKDDPPQDVPSVGGPDPTNVIGSGPLTPTALRASRSGARLVFSWTAPESRPGDSYLVLSGPGPDQLKPVGNQSATSVSLVVPRGDLVCIKVTATRDGAPSGDLEKCLVAP